MVSVVQEDNKTQYLESTVVPLVLHGLAFCFLLAIVLVMRSKVKGQRLPESGDAPPHSSKVFALTNKTLFPVSYSDREITNKCTLWLANDISYKQRHEIDMRVGKLTDSPWPLIRLVFFAVLPIQPLITIIALAADQQKTNLWNTELALAIVTFLVSLVNAFLLVPLLNDLLRRKQVGKWNTDEINLRWCYSGSSYGFYTLEAYTIKLFVQTLAAVSSERLSEKA